MKRRLIRLGAEPEKIHVIHYGLPLSTDEDNASLANDIVLRTRTRDECAIPEDASIILMPARYAANKRHDLAVLAFAQLCQKLPNARLLFAGEAFVGDALRVRAIDNQIDQLWLRQRVHRLGFWGDMPRLYAAADVVLLPSEDDPLPLTILEAMAAGVPIVAARSGGTPEMIEHGISGLLVEPGDADGFASALAEVLTDKDRRECLIEGALRRCRAEFSLSGFVRQVARLYERVLAVSTLRRTTFERASWPKSSPTRYSFQDTFTRSFPSWPSSEGADTMLDSL